MFSKKEMATFNALYYLYAISQSNSKREVADLLGTSVDTINKYISDIENVLKVTLLNSNGRGTALTQEGRYYAKIAETIVLSLRKMSHAENYLSMVNHTLKISMPDIISYDFGENNINAFIKSNPDVNIVTEIEDRPGAKADICLSLYPLKGGSWEKIAEKNIPCGLYASKNYLKKYGMPKNYNDMIKRHRICNKSSSEYYIPGWGEVLRTAHFIVLWNDSIFSHYSAIKNGVGIGICSCDYGRRNLIRVNTISNFDTSCKIYLNVRKYVLTTPQLKSFLEFSKVFFNGPNQQRYSKLVKKKMSR